MSRQYDRAPHELRPTTLTPDYLMHPEGSVLIEVGRTRVICAASVEDRLPRFAIGTGSGWIGADENDWAKIDSLFVQNQLSRLDASDVEQIIDEPLDELGLSDDHIHCAARRIRLADTPFQRGSGVEDGSKWVAQLVTQGSHEFVLSMAGLAGLFALTTAPHPPGVVVADVRGEEPIVIAVRP